MPALLNLYQTEANAKFEDAVHLGIANGGIHNSGASMEPKKPPTIQTYVPNRA